MKFSIQQLIQANALMFPYDFEVLFKKHAPKSYSNVPDSATYMATVYRTSHKSNLLLFISEYCRQQDELTKTIEKMIAEILKLEYEDELIKD